MWSAASLALGTGAIEPNHVRQLPPIDRVEPAVLGSDRHDDSMSHRAGKRKQIIRRLLPFRIFFVLFARVGMCPIQDERLRRLERPATWPPKRLPLQLPATTTLMPVRRHAVAVSRPKAAKTLSSSFTTFITDNYAPRAVIAGMNECLKLGGARRSGFDLSAEAKVSVVIDYYKSIISKYHAQVSYSSVRRIWLHRASYRRTRAKR